MGSWPFGTPRMFVYCYFVDGLLIDTGHRNVAKLALPSLTQLPVEQQFITHHHEDHNGNLPALHRHFGVPVRTTAACAAILKKPPRVSLAQWLTWGQNRPFQQFELVEKELTTSNYTFQIIPTPGHAVDHVCLYEAKEGWLFSADLYVYHRIKFFMRNESMRQQIASIRKVLTLDFDRLFCSHNPQMEGGKVLLKKKLQFFEDFYGQVVHWHQQGNEPVAIMRRMNLKPQRRSRWLSQGELSTINMVQSVLRDEGKRPV